MTITNELADSQRDLKIWLFEKCLPIWFAKGADLEKGGFYERLNQDLSPNDIDRRTRVAVRQVYSYALAKKMGYEGDTSAIKQGLDWLHGPCMDVNGYLYAVLAPDGKVVRSEFDLYDHAFYLLGLASAFSIDAENLEYKIRAESMRDKILKKYWRTSSGFEEAIPPILPLKANPHMHTFEASIAWVEAGGDEKWYWLAKNIAELSRSLFFDSQTGAILELFDTNWQPFEKIGERTIEPGHQFEWAWLFLRWGKICGDTSYNDIAKKLIVTGEKYGVDKKRGLAFMAHNDEFVPIDSFARLWSQTERVKAHVRSALIESDAILKDQSILMAQTALKGLLRYFDTPIKGLYWDRIDPQGNIINESSPSSSLYHIICAIDEFCKL